MSYCVNCGVELSEDLQACPLCHTPVYHPDRKPETEAAAPVFPRERGSVDAVNNDVAILFSVVLLSTCLACGVLNLLVFRAHPWAVYVIGACGVLWVFVLPVILVRKLPALLSLLADGVAVSLYCGLIAWFHPGAGWFGEVALPLIWAVAVSAILFAAVFRWRKSSILVRACVLFAEAGLLAMLVEVVLNLHFAGRVFVSWSAVVGTCCGVIVAALVTIIRRSALREEVRRRMHL